ncbi:hypothetical protein C4D60_Mb11t02180 [Musa balbisiana]|uniref:Uncharacterized protein n=1 Tax=Musa balbisiana TaxID=52838 RepID=A0A4S8J169_MUSBA|nr:hypothetical protein C4D60_Mb11t02180 [Musa balbisiana]
MQCILEQHTRSHAYERKSLGAISCHLRDTRVRRATLRASEDSSIFIIISGPSATGGSIVAPISSSSATGGSIVAPISSSSSASLAVSSLE